MNTLSPSSSLGIESVTLSSRVDNVSRETRPSLNKESIFDFFASHLLTTEFQKLPKDQDVLE